MTMTLLVALVIAVCVISLVSLVVSVKTSKTVSSEAHVAKERIAARLIEDPIINNMRKELVVALDGLTFYKQESTEWHNRYRAEQMEHQRTKIEFTNRIKGMETKINTLEYIVEKMDGKTIVRDENQRIKLVK